MSADQISSQLFTQRSEIVFFTNYVKKQMCDGGDLGHKCDMYVHKLSD